MKSYKNKKKYSKKYKKRENINNKTKHNKTKHNKTKHNKTKHKKYNGGVSVSDYFILQNVKERIKNSRKQLSEERRRKQL